jgi:Ras-related protein Rab-1A
MLKYKIILSGAKGIGKTSLITRYIEGKFYETSQETIGVAFKRKKIKLEDNLTIEATIWDFGGEEKYRTLFPQYVQGATAALILYDTTNKETINDVHNWVDLVDAYASEDVLKVLIGTKIDLKDQREITKEKAKKSCEKYNWCAEIIETSSKTGENVEDAFINIAREIVDIKFQKCKACGDYFSKKLKFCVNCGEKVELEAISL